MSAELEVASLHGDDLLAAVMAKKLDHWSAEMARSAAAMRAMGSCGADVAKGNDQLSADLAHSAQSIRSLLARVRKLEEALSEIDAKARQCAAMIDASYHVQGYVGIYETARTALTGEG